MVAQNLEPPEETPPVDENAAEVDQPEGDAPPAEPEVQEETPEVEPDPLAEVVGRVDALDQAAQRLNGINPERLNSLLGLVPGLQSEIDQLKNANPLADLDPRISANEGVAAAVAQALLNSDLVDETAKGPLRQSLDALVEARSTREVDRLVRERLAEQQAQTPEPTPAQDISPRLIAQALLESYAEGKGVEWNTIPTADLAFLPNETVEQAAARVRGMIDSLASEETATERVATRRQAAGNGSPARSGGATTTADLLSRLESDDGIPMTDEAARKRAAKELGVELPS